MTIPTYWPEINVRKLFGSVNAFIFLRSNGAGGVSESELLNKIDNSFLKEFKSQITICEREISDASSTAIRNGETGFLFDNVRRYIEENKISFE